MIDFLWRSVLFDFTLVEDENPVRERHGLHLVMRNKHGRCPDPFVEFGKFNTSIMTQLGIEVRKWFVEQQHGGLAHDGATNCNTLALTTGKLTWLAGQVVGEPRAASLRRPPPLPAVRPW